MKIVLTVSLFLIACFANYALSDEIVFKENLRLAKGGDYIVTAQNKMLTIFLIQEKDEHTVTIDEISAPTHSIGKYRHNWKGWIEQGAPYNSSWVRYTLDLQTGGMLDYFSFTKNSWFSPKENNFLTTLLNLPMQRISNQERKKVGNSTYRQLWQPKMIFEGQTIPNICFSAWTAKWPNDGSELSGRTVELYTPEINSGYPSYFPYWLQVNRAVGNAKIRIIDSGINARSFYKKIPK